MESRQAKILGYCLKNAVFDGWTTKLLENASISAGLNLNYWKIIFPRGTLDVLAFYEKQIDRELAKKFAEANTANLRTHEKIRELIKLRLQILERNKPALPSIIQISLLSATAATARVYTAVDTMWRLAGDDSTDWNFYTKRALLANVYTTTLIFWLNDKSENNSESWQFLNRRLANIASFGKATSKVKEFTKKFTHSSLRTN